ncbi:MAG: hypothetical protein P1U64_10705 [Alcanivoracaceae bacterium]|nr:hypothetical protein [Alcanivoracaceae bacterium]
MIRSTLALMFAGTVAGLLALASCDGSSDYPLGASGNSHEPQAEIEPGTAGTLDRQLPADPSLTYTREAVIPPQCYTRTVGRFNPCYTCHQTYDDKHRPNYMRDGYLQGVYDFSDQGLTNHWRNLFVDRTAQVAAISDADILDWIRTDNFTPFLEKLRSDDAWTGPEPALENLHAGAAAFDAHGFAKDGSGWVAFNYKPLPSTFWPTNGSTDDVMIQLPEAFRSSSCHGDSKDSRDTYLANLSILEMAIKGLDSISTPPIDEQGVCQDLDGNGVLDVITHLPRRSTYAGMASSIAVQSMRYPVGTRFLHTVRYVDVDSDGNISISARMKEVRYMRKIQTFENNELLGLYGNELQEKLDGNLPRYPNHQDRGFYNKFGWEIIGWIEDRNGELRQQAWQEQQFCMGCHTTLGTTIDHTFAFPRKVTGAQGWGYIDLRGMEDVPALGQADGEILQYLRRVGGGNEFRENPEMQARWFDADGNLDVESVRAADVYTLVTPSRQRALALNKAYRVIVSEQSFLYGRDATIEPATNVYEQVDPARVTPLPADAHVHNYDIRLQWPD